MKKFWFAAVFLAVPGLCEDAYSQVNAGFETGDTYGWVETYPSYDGKISVVSSWGAGGALYRPAEGNYFTVVETGVYDGEFTTLSQKLSLKGGETLGGWAGFCCGSEVGWPYPGDNGDYNDFGRITVLNGLGELIATPWYADSFDIGYNLTMPDGQPTGEVISFGPVMWEGWSWTAPGEDVYTLQYQTTQGDDSEGLSYAFFDGLDGGVLTAARSTSASVPEPSSMALVALAAGGVAVSRRLAGRAGRPA